MVCKIDLIEDQMDNYPEFIINMLKVDFLWSSCGCNRTIRDFTNLHKNVFLWA